MANIFGKLDETDPLYPLYSATLKQSVTAQPKDSVPTSNPQPSGADGVSSMYDPNFVNYNQRVQANQEAGQKMADQLTANVGGKGTAAKQSIDAASSQFGGSANSDRPPVPVKASTGQSRGGDIYSYANGSYTQPAEPPTNASASTSSAPVPAGSKSTRSASPSSTSAPATSTINSTKSPTSAPASTTAAATAPPPGNTVAPVTASNSAYSGSNSLLDKNPQLQDQAKQAAIQANQLGNDVDRMNSVNDLYGKNSSYYGTGASGLDSALAGAQGHGELAQTQSEFGGLDNYLQQANDKSIQQVKDRQGRDAAAVAANAARVKGLAEEAARKKAAGDAAAADKAKTAKKQSFNEYVNTNKTENTVNSVTQALDPIADLLHAFGQKSAEDYLVPGMEGYVNQNGGQLHGNKINWDAVMPGAGPAADQAVYDSMTQAELDAVEAMAPNQQSAWLMKRFNDLNDKAAASITEADKKKTQDLVTGKWN